MLTYLYRYIVHQDMHLLLWNFAQILDIFQNNLYSEVGVNYMVKPTTCPLFNRILKIIPGVVFPICG